MGMVSSLMQHVFYRESQRLLAMISLPYRLIAPSKLKGVYLMVITISLNKIKTFLKYIFAKD